LNLGGSRTGRQGESRGESRCRARGDVRDDDGWLLKRERSGSGGAGFEHACTAGDDASTGGCPTCRAGNGNTREPLPVGDAWAVTTTTGQATKWQTTIDGLVEIPQDPSSPVEGARCFAILGAMTPTEIADGALVTSLYDTPTFSVVIDGRVPNEIGMCDTDALTAAGWASGDNAAVSVGTAFPFFSEVFVPASVTGTPQLIAVGLPAGDAMFFEGTVLTAIPSP